MTFQKVVLGSAIMLTLILTGCGEQSTPKDAPEQLNDVAMRAPEITDEKGAIHPEKWAKQASPFTRDAVMEARIEDLLAKMTLEEKVGQIIQADIASVTPDEVREYNLGSVLNGGNSAPGGDNRTTPEAWLALADEYWKASTDTSDGGVSVPALWGTDAVHGHNNIVGATLFPHNIGLGAANNPDLMYKIGEVTAKELLVTGLDWTFAPTIAVVRDDRWGRTYESYSENPAIVASYSGRLVEGIQGVVNTEEFLDGNHLISTVKHFVGDGGTIDGVDQGNNINSEENLRDIQAAGYPPAIAKGAQVVMASFNGYHGRKMHGHKELLTDVLVDRMGFDGFVVGDWNGHGQVDGCTNVSCAASINAGIDMFMAPDSWKLLYANTLEQVKNSKISQERLDEAVGRILRVKMRAGFFDAGLPSQRTHSGKFDLLSSAEHQDVARQAVRESLVLLKNNNQTLPLNSAATILVAGDGAHNIGKQAGGWTLSWQGTGNKNSDFPKGSSIFDGVKAAASNAYLSEDGSYEEQPDVAIVVFGEDPYAEFQGDKPNVNFSDDRGLNLLNKFKEEGIPTVAVFLSGRPMWVNTELNAADAFVAAWLPGSVGAGVADVLVSKQDGTINHDFKGKLSFSWPRLANETINVGDGDYDPLFAYGYGLTYTDETQLAILPEDNGLGDDAGGATEKFLVGGDALAPWRMELQDEGGKTQVTDATANSSTGKVTANSADYQAQEDTRIVEWRGKGVLAVNGNPVDFSHNSNGDMAIEIQYNVLGSEIGPTMFGMSSNADNASDGGMIDYTEQLKAKIGEGWQTSRLKLSCFAAAGANMTQISAPLVIVSEGPLKVQVASAGLVSHTGDASCDL